MRRSKSHELYKKWRISVETSLKSKYGNSFYKEMGKLGGRKFIQTVDKKTLNKQLEKAFRNSFRTKITFNGLKLRSRKEFEVAKFLSLKEIPFQYEKKIMNFYPDFLIDNDLIIEVFGFDCKLHKERTIEKIKRINKNYKVIVYTYPNCVSYFDKLSVDVATNTDQLSKIILGYKRG